MKTLRPDTLDSARVDPRSALEGANKACIDALWRGWDGFTQRVLLDLRRRDDLDERVVKHAKALMSARGRTTLTELSSALSRELDALAGELTSDAAAGSLARAEEAVVDGTSAFEQRLVLGRVAARLTDPSSMSFHQLGWRLANLLSLRTLPSSRHPYRPAVFVRSLLRVFLLNGLNAEDALALCKALDAALVEALPAVYAAIDADLDARGVPVLKHREAPPPTLGGEWSANVSRRAHTVLTDLMDVAEVLRKAEEPAASEAAAADDAAAEARDAALDAAAAPPAPDPNAWLRAQLDEIAEHLQSAHPLPDLLAQMQERWAPAWVLSALAVNDVLAQSLRGQHLALPFARLAHALKWPCFAAALQSPQIVVQRENGAAARLATSVAMLALGWRADCDDGDRLLRDVTSILRSLFLSPCGNDDLMAAVAALDDLLARRDDRLADARQRWAEAHTQTVWLEVRQVSARIAVGKALQGRIVEPFLREFLLNRWTQVLVAADLLDSQRPGIAHRFRQVAVDLAWSVQPKIAEEERQLLSASVAGIISDVQRGLLMIGASTEEQQQFLARLMRAHAEAMQPATRTRADAPAPAAPVRAVATRPGGRRTRNRAAGRATLSRTHVSTGGGQ